MLSKTGVLGVVVVVDDPKLARVVELGQVQRLECLQGSVSNDDLLGEGALDERVNLGRARVVLERLPKIDQRGRGVLAERRLGADELDHVVDRRQTGVGGVRDWKRRRSGRD